MGKTFKDKALHFAHKPDEMPTTDVKDLVKIFSKFGNLTQVFIAIEFV